MYFYRDERGVPVLDWMKELRAKDRKAYAKCAARIRLLAQLGNDLRRPLADYMEQGIYELRIRKGRINYRMLYFFHGSHVAILVHALVKEGEITATDLQRALNRKSAVEEDPDIHTYAGK